MAHQSKYPSLDRQWHKMMFCFFEYLPMQYRQATEREWQIRKMIWSFKDGKAYLNIAWMIANKLHQVFGDDVKNIVFACVPASSADKNELRYKGFASAVCKFSGAINAYEHIRVSGNRLAIHEKFDSKSLQKVQVIEFDKDFFRGKKILVFDDILTKGFSYARFACQLEKIGGKNFMAMLEVKDLEVYYGMIQAIKGISFEVNQGEVIALIGANGAGKTTTLQTITGMLQAKKGHILFEGQDITKVPGHKIVTMGMAHVPEGRRVFANLSVYENLKLGAYTRKDKNEIAQSLEMVYESFPRLKERRNQSAGTLSGGEQQMLAMGRALMSKPRIVLMDEPSMGLSPIFVDEIFKIIQKISAEGTTVLLVEQNAKKALAIADRAYVLETGKIALSGDAKELMNNESIKKAYLGE